jgi:hypothetical protein
VTEQDQLQGLEASRARGARSAVSEPRTFERLLLAGVWLACAVAIAAVCLRAPPSAPYLTVLGVAATVAVAVRLQGLSIRSSAAGLRPRSWPGAALGLFVGVALVAAVVRLPAVLSSGYSSLSGRTPPLAQADIQPLASAGSVAAIAAAARTIPVGATYSVVGGAGYQIPQIFRFWLAPRIFTADYDAAHWIVVYGRPPPADLPKGTRIALDQGSYVLRTAS